MDSQQNIINTTSIFGRTFLNSRAYFQYCYRQVPCVMWVGQVNTEKVLDYIKTEYAETVKGIFQYSEYQRKKGKAVYDITIVLLNEN